MSVLRDAMFPQFHLCYTQPPIYWPLGQNPTLDRRLHFRMACLTVKEKEAFDIIRPLATMTVTKCEGAPALIIDSGEVIDAEEWEDEWAEGTRY
jgi:hypothetical protein